jgi:hypothetical protein
MFQTGEREQSSPLPAIDEQIEVAVLGVGARQNRAEKARPRHVVPADKFAQFISMGGQGVGRSHTPKLTDSGRGFNNSPRQGRFRQSL